MKRIVFIVIAAAMVLASCSAPRQVAYFQDVSGKDTLIANVGLRPLKVQPGERLMIVVHSSVPELAATFNLPVIGYRLGTNNTNQNNNFNSTYATMSYIVSPEGTIDFPVLGTIKVEGMTRNEVAEHIKHRLVSENHCTDAVVNVELSNAYVNVMGEVNRPGRYELTQDNVTILDVLSQASDLNVLGLRQNVMVSRKTAQGTQVYTLDMTNMQQLLSSPAYMMQQGDMVYVEPNKVRKRQTTVSGNNLLNTGFWISVASLITSIISVIVR
ncbi:MAG: polysaccharide biosynthesis/export family protein [Bacteroidales bacterium]|nr:polysaccharide biosynthesis/export family protein [Candidatus Cacconaster scatequi]